MNIDITYGGVNVAGMAQEAGTLRVARISRTHTHPANALPAAHAAGSAAAAAVAAPSKRRTTALTLASVIGGNR